MLIEMWCKKHGSRMTYNGKCDVCKMHKDSKEEIKFMVPIVLTVLFLLILILLSS